MGLCRASTLLIIGLVSIVLAKDAIIQPIAVLPVRVDSITKKDASAIDRSLMNALVKTGKYAVVEQERINEVLAQQAFQQTGVVSDQEAVKIGNVLGAKLIIAGHVEKSNSGYWTDFRIIDVETAAIKSSNRCFFHGTFDDLLKFGIPAEVSGLVGNEKQRKELLVKHILNWGEEKSGYLLKFKPASKNNQVRNSEKPLKEEIEAVAEDFKSLVKGSDEYKDMGKKVQEGFGFLIEAAVRSIDLHVASGGAEQDLGERLMRENAKKALAIFKEAGK
jgi:hypothetical protein